RAGKGTRGAWCVVLGGAAGVASTAEAGGVVESSSAPWKVWAALDYPAGIEKPSAEAVFNDVDIDRDGILNFDEFVAFAFDPNLLDETAREQYFHSAFDCIRSSDNGVDRVGFKELFAVEAFPLVDRLFDEIDADHSGKISYEEFAKYVLDLNRCGPDAASGSAIPPPGRLYPGGIQNIDDPRVVSHTARVIQSPLQHTFFFQYKRADWVSDWRDIDVVLARLFMRTEGGQDDWSKGFGWLAQRAGALQPSTRLYARVICRKSDLWCGPIGDCFFLLLNR
ncbi:unnamed protein product, partial [Prorocentrum cordatum]